ncbi:PEP-CTERM sorting domain-containing protein [Paenibacillus methanolicus]|uniref:Putative secreted protein with PEP-CTERM sorting signal n=1 Tax=Paenibacillus methanolicus TaxID=582686 RepID=A0A5S5BVL3_9BACL|nr:PEP-CTERM sorting domain-containing protein [Paenibacillus methanolicus]TYP70200.1 putative secreted protein with PEP-CTERM sorting signal [Paenibacillus methanolicus]
MSLYHLYYIIIFSVLLALGIGGMAWFVFHRRKRKAR